jgi:hypothetical protein
VDEVIVYGLASPQVRQRLERLLVDLASVAAAERRAVVEARLKHLRALSQESRAAAG